MGIDFAYESKAYRDKEKRRSHAKRALVGRLDERTGGIVPVDGRAKSARKRAAGERGCWSPAAHVAAFARRRGLLASRMAR